MFSPKDRNKRLQCPDQWGLQFFLTDTKNEIRTYDNIKNLPQAKKLTTQLVACLIMHTPKVKYKLIAIDLSK